MAEALDFEQTSVGRKADRRQVTQPLAAEEVVRVVGFGTSPGAKRSGGSGNLLRIRLDPGALVIDRIAEVVRPIPAKRRFTRS
jgi:hypothetical protein